MVDVLLYLAAVPTVTWIIASIVFAIAFGTGFMRGEPAIRPIFYALIFGTFAICASVIMAGMTPVPSGLMTGFVALMVSVLGCLIGRVISGVTSVTI